MSETQRTAIDIARDHAHSQRESSELHHWTHAAGINPPNRDRQISARAGAGDDGGRTDRAAATARWKGPYRRAEDQVGVGEPGAEAGDGVAGMCAGRDCITLDDRKVVAGVHLRTLPPTRVGAVRGGDVLFRQPGPEVPVLAAGSCRFGCAAVGFEAGNIVHGELLPGSGHLVGEGDRGSSSRAAWLCAPTMPSNLERSRTETSAVFRNSCSVRRRIRGQ